MHTHDYVQLPKLQHTMMGRVTWKVTIKSPGCWTTLWTVIPAACSSSGFVMVVWNTTEGRVLQKYCLTVEVGFQHQQSWHTDKMCVCVRQTLE